MSCQNLVLTRCRLDRVIRVLCTLIENRIKSQAVCPWSEADLRKELVGCILSSQVRNETAIASTENLDRAGLLEDAWWSESQVDNFASRVFEVLSGKREDLPYQVCHRFFRSRSRQLSQARDALAEFPLRGRLATVDSPRELRRCLVSDIPGVGPKQASMFLRNISASYDLAILDMHVLRFMEIQDLLTISQVRISTVSGYEKTERVVVEYADSLGYPVGYLDWAIWATMKAARELGL
jgi:N-glycosylase/DNA lyase